MATVVATMKRPPSTMKPDPRHRRRAAADRLRLGAAGSAITILTGSPRRGLAKSNISLLPRFDSHRSVTGTAGGSALVSAHHHLCRRGTVR
ncbi:hypothetical protein GCM10007884_44450 [Methylobacterium brachythecii]|uniref:Uncharacterized protein n=1 Tax=Methylobacterium brachythecii TaxID=1176177 RepID=A0ABQ6D9Q5_9HYPH|nr:hypothetical protein GCM10007884_44450 [Methylobacterium brachythecii]